MSTNDILEKAFIYFDIPKKYRNSFGKIRERRYVITKRSVTYILHTIYKTPYREIARLLNIHRTTVLWYIHDMNDAIKYDKSLCKYYCEFKKYLFQ